MTTLHYIYDPLCGWCYAAAPLVHAARGVEGLPIAMHGGGMLAGPNRRPITPDWREYVVPHDRRIEQMTGQHFGEAYLDGLLRDTGAVMDSEPPTTAILAAESLGGRGLDMLHRLQRAHYVEGQRIAERNVIDALAQDIGLDAAAFASAYDAHAGAPTEKHFAESHRWLARAGGQGFPTLALEIPTEDPEATELVKIEVGPFLGRPEALADALREALSSLAQQAAR